jgi:hypothetical protein
MGGARVFFLSLVRGYHSPRKPQTHLGSSTALWKMYRLSKLVATCGCATLLSLLWTLHACILFIILRTIIRCAF